MRPVKGVDLAGARVTVMGLGRFGGGLGVTRWLARAGARVLVTDTAQPESLKGPIASIRPLIDQGSVLLRLGGHDPADFASADMVIANPAVPKPWANPLLSAARDAQVPITTEIQLVLDQLPDVARTIAVTGTAGKSTTASLIAHALGELGQRVELGGNIGGSLLDRIGSLDPSAWVVLELSSAMLWWLESPASRVAVVTGFAPNHLDWHGSQEHYRLSKQRLVDALKPGSTAVLGPTVADWPTPRAVEVVRVGSQGTSPDLRIPGAHNALNARLAAEAVHALGVPGIDRMRALGACSSFNGLAHRLERVASVRGVDAINDSKSTTPEATRLALEALKERPGLRHVHLIAGGYDKGADLGPIARVACELAGLYAIGQTAEAIVSASDGYAVGCGVLSNAVRRAWHSARPGDTILLSPGCASWDQYSNFEERGRAFVDAFAALESDRPPPDPGP